MFKSQSPKVVLSYLSLALCSKSVLQANTPLPERPPLQGINHSIERVGKLKIRTTAYTHIESDHLQYGKLAAAGNTLRYGKVNSAAADWSKFPLGTIFKIAGRDELYVIDDYGSALVGKEVIDLYQPTAAAMDAWGVRHVEIELVKWGCFEKSLEILTPRVEKAEHVRHMVETLKQRHLIEL